MHVKILTALLHKQQSNLNQRYKQKKKKMFQGLFNFIAFKRLNKYPFFSSRVYKARILGFGAAKNANIHSVRFSKTPGY